MADNYLNLYHLEVTGPFEVARIIDEDLQASSECVLPPHVPPTITLPSFPELPALECLYDVDLPLFPPAYFKACFPTFTGGINVYSCDENTATVTSTVEITNGGEDSCDFTLGGDIEICIPECSSPSSTATWDTSWSSDYISGSIGLTVSLENCMIAVAGMAELTWTGPEVCSVTIDAKTGTGESVNIPIVAGADLELNWNANAYITGGPCNFQIEINVDISGSVTGLSTKTITICNGSSSESVQIVTVA